MERMREKIEAQLRQFDLQVVRPQQVSGQLFSSPKSACSHAPTSRKWRSSALPSAVTPSLESRSSPSGMLTRLSQPCDGL